MTRRWYAIVNQHDEILFVGTADLCVNHFLAITANQPTHCFITSMGRREYE